LLFRFVVVLLFEDGMGKIQKTCTVKVLSKTKNGGRILISTADVDRDRDRVIPTGVSTENYRKNPVVQWGHNYQDPWSTIGKTTKLDVSPEGITAEFELRPAANEQDPQNVVRLLWEGGWIKAASIGFIPNAAKTKANDLGGSDFGESELLEWSLVPIPANQSALALAVKAFGMKAEGDEPQDEPEAPAASKGPDCRQADESEDECVARKLAEILEEAPDTPEDEAAARAAEMCAQSCEDEEQPQDEPAPADEPTPDAEQEGKRAAPLAKRGRVLSASNESKLRTAYESIGEVLSAVGDAPEQNAVSAVAHAPASAPVKAAKAAPKPAAVDKPALDTETIAQLGEAIAAIRKAMPN
jgi:HK97 family phage prohead protease